MPKEIEVKNAYADIEVKNAYADIIKICLEGHQYYSFCKWNCSAYQGGIAPVLTDDGKPVKCEE
jgi:hypothetical protein